MTALYNDSETYTERISLSGNAGGTGSSASSGGGGSSSTY